VNKVAQGETRVALLNRERMQACLFGWKASKMVTLVEYAMYGSKKLGHNKSSNDHLLLAMN